MRDFRDPKAMVQALRDGLKARGVELAHSQCLELIARAFGHDDWNILSAKIAAAQDPGGFSFGSVTRAIRIYDPAKAKEFHIDDRASNWTGSTAAMIELRSTSSFRTRA